MSANAIETADPGVAARAVRIPALPGRQMGAAGVDVDCDAYKAGVNAAAAEQRAEAAAQEARHEAFAQSVGDMLGEMDAHYRRECLSLIERLFSAVAPTLAQRSSLADIMALIEERLARAGGALTLRAHPSLVEHLPAQAQRVLQDAPKVTLETDPECAPAAIDARWDKGGLFHDPDSLIEEILAALNPDAAPQQETRDE